jgi:hypothetical protein
MPICFDRLYKLNKRSKQLDLPRRLAASSFEAVLGISSHLLADITSGVTDVTAVCTVKI